MAAFVALIMEGDVIPEWRSMSKIVSGFGP
jgi:hypothetical protein